MPACSPSSDMTDTTACQIDVSGIVQGVGFRPFVYRLAHSLGVSGEVANTATGVTIVLEGTAAAVDAFVTALPRQKPPLATIVALRVSQIAPTGRTTFTIAHSQTAQHRDTLISPDVAVCADCLRELFDPADRRFRYPFINCTNCGPRYTIIDDIPYDRPHTAMRTFTLCAQCQAEYDNPLDRRFHAQPNACARCGPRVTLLDRHRQPIADEDPVAQATRLLATGHIVAIKGLGGFHLCVDACQDTAVERLRQRKQREEKPLAVMAANLDAIRSFAQLDTNHARLLESVQRPIVLLPKLLPEKLAFSVAPRNLYYGVMLPYTPLHYLLFEHPFAALVMTSANPSQEPIVIDNDEAFIRLGAIADYFLLHDRPILLRSDDSILRLAAGQVRSIRRSRGYVPAPIGLQRRLPPVLACGAEVKNTICLTKADQAFVSQHIGDLENLETHAFFEQTIRHMQRILDVRPERLACDPHPDYFSTQWAKAQGDLPVIEVQHHYAHIAAGMAEHHLEGPVLGLALDGSGLGTDHTIWGGELLLADWRGFERVGHLMPVPMPGGAKAIQEPWRMGVAYVYHALGADFWNQDLPLLRRVEQAKIEMVRQMIDARVNTPLTSSLGRLFDGVAAIVGLRTHVAFEGQAAMELEMIADGHDQTPYPFALRQGSALQIEIAPIVAGVVADLNRHVPAFVISRRFHTTVVDMWTAMCVAVRKRHDIRHVVLGGGCFQNVLLLEGLQHRLEALGFSVFSPAKVPANDGGICLGQAAVAAFSL